MHITWELQTKKANFLFKNTQVFYQTIHAAPHWATLFTDNIIIYFNYQVFMLHLFKRSYNGMSWGGIVLQIFWLNAGLFTHFWFHHCFPRWLTVELFVIRNSKYSLPISNPNILYQLIVCQNVVNYPEAWLCEGHWEIFGNFLWRSHFNSECQTTCSGMLKPRWLLTYFSHNSFCYFHFRTHNRCVVVVREVADREVADWEVADREVEG